MRKKGRLYLVLFIIALLGLIFYWILTSELFERQKPSIQIASKLYWNLRKPIDIKISDNSGIKSYTVTMDDGKNREVLEQRTFENPPKEVQLSLERPMKLEFPRNRAILHIEVQDKSLWHYFLGNRSVKDIKIIIDTKRPELYLVNNSYSITKGGSALVVFHCNDDNLKEFYVQTNFGKRFYAQPFYEEGYYAALIAWPVTQKRFRATLVAYDKAGNRSKVHVPLYLLNKKYRVSKITLKKNFLEGKVALLAEDYPETAKMDPLEKFKFVNETLRERNEQLIHKLTSKVPKEMFDSFSIKPFYPLKNGARVASFGDHRYYYYHGKLVSESYHLGLDLASTRAAPIKASNPGDVVFADYNGIYGNMPLISHGLGLYTLYGHCSTLFVKKGDQVERGETIAKTGNTGLALGDHLHFGVLVQGVEVRPKEWMDKKWIKDNIIDVLKEAKKIINSK
ncbi:MULTISPECIES: M23 family metallopeptidase [unclassified Nitratiruptor]|uniref:M23 family metallopeptidase n=1 Tax=unclassified Nitratiruptor TaxID=2624044 RepID=UPI0019156A5E|nr:MULTISPECIES: M23 family metallopeptidase [unclassified Nitratiruptor]BCD59755.1 peptidase, M23/M37 family [Nitratiruptor sp. YY08-10]BCD63679.1 peptidase, M23/M37 family [Nitratiruptor sp. YY08-14]